MQWAISLEELVKVPSVLIWKTSTHRPGYLPDVLRDQVLPPGTQCLVVDEHGHGLNGRDR
jgi:hypothetical protein